MAEETKKSTVQDSDKTMGILSYIGPLALIPYFAAKDSKFVRFHARQGLALAIIEVVVWVLFSMFIFPTLFLGLGPILGLVSNLVSLITLVLSIMGIINVVNNKEVSLPVVSNIADMLKL